MYSLLDPFETKCSIFRYFYIVVLAPSGRKRSVRFFGLADVAWYKMYQHKPKCDARHGESKQMDVQV